MKQRSGSSSLSALKLKSFSSVMKWCAAHYTRHMKCHVSSRDLYGLCVNTRTDSGKSLAVWMNQNQTIPGQITGHIFRVFSRMAVWKRLIKGLLIALRHKYLFLLSCGFGYIFRHSQRQLFVKVSIFFVVVLVWNVDEKHKFLNYY